MKTHHKIQVLHPTIRKNKLIPILFLSFTFFSSHLFGQINQLKLNEPIASNIDAAVFDQNTNSIFCFSNSVFLEYNLRTTKTKRKPLHTMNRFSFEKGKIDAAVKINPNFALLFQGNTYFEFDIYKKVVTNKDQWPLPDVWGRKLDAAIQWNDDLILLIRGTEYISFTISTGEVSPLQALWFELPQHWKKVDAGFNTMDGFMYFFHQSEFLVYDMDQKVLAGQPRDIKTGKFIQPSVSSTFRPPVTNQMATFASNEKQEVDVSNWCVVGYPSSSGSEDSKLMEVTGKLAGDKKGTRFEDQLYEGSRVAEIRVYGTSMVNGIQVVLESQSGELLEQAPIGSNRGAYESFKLDYDECISGVMGNAYGNLGARIYSIQFRTNKSVSKIFGGKGRSTGKKPFTKQVPYGGSFNGFVGFADNYVNAIGLKFLIYDSNYVEEEEQLAEGDFNDEEEGSGESDGTCPDLNEYCDNPEEFTINSEGFDSGLKTIPGPDWFEQGIDILYIDPYALTNTGKKAEILELITSDKKGGNKYVIPHGFKYKLVSQGSFDENQKLIKSYEEFSKKFERSVGLSGEKFGKKSGESSGKGGGMGSLSHSVKKMNKRAFGQDKIYFVNYRIREVHALEMKPNWTDNRSHQKYRHLLTYDFRKAIEDLPAPTSILNEPAFYEGQSLPNQYKAFEEAYMNIIDVYGTHLAKKVTFGGSYIYCYEITKKQVNNLNMSEEQFSAAVKIPIKQVALGGSFQMESGQSNAGVNGSETFSASGFVSGGGGATDQSVWENSVLTDPVPVSIELVPLSSYLNEIYFPDDPDIDKKAATLQAITNWYIAQNILKIESTESHGRSFQFPDGVKKAVDKRTAETAKPTVFNYEVKLNHIYCNTSDQSSPGFYGEVVVKCDQEKGENVLFENNKSTLLRIKQDRSDYSCEKTIPFTDIKEGNFTITSAFKEYEPARAAGGRVLTGDPLEIKDSDLEVDVPYTEELTLTRVVGGKTLLHIDISITITKTTK